MKMMKNERVTRKFQMNMKKVTMKMTLSMNINNLHSDDLYLMCDRNF